MDTEQHSAVTHTPWIRGQETIMEKIKIPRGSPPRNPYVAAARTRSGAGRHVKKAGAQRQQHKRQLRRELAQF